MVFPQQLVQYPPRLCPTQRYSTPSELGCRYAFLLFVFGYYAFGQGASPYLSRPHTQSEIVWLLQLLGDSTEQMSASLGQTLAGLLNASFGNAVEIIVGIAALLQGLYPVPRVAYAKTNFV